MASKPLGSSNRNLAGSVSRGSPPFWPILDIEFVNVESNVMNSLTRKDDRLTIEENCIV